MCALPISKPRFKSIVFNQKIPKMKLFLQKNAKFSSAGGSAPRPPKQPPHCEFLATRLQEARAPHQFDFANQLKCINRVKLRGFVLKVAS